MTLKYNFGLSTVLYFPEVFVILFLVAIYKGTEVGKVDHSSRQLFTRTYPQQVLHSHWPFHCYCI